MSLPAEIDFALIKIGDGASPEVFTLICGLTDVTYNETAQTVDRHVRDCTRPGETPYRKTKVSGRSLDVTGSGMSNVTQLPTLEAALGKVVNYLIEFYRDDGSNAGVLLGTTSGAFRMDAKNLNIPRDNPATAQITLKSDGAWTYTGA